MIFSFFSSTVSFPPATPFSQSLLLLLLLHLIVVQYRANILLRGRLAGMVFQIYGDVGLVVAAGWDSKDIIFVRNGYSTVPVGECPGQLTFTPPLPFPLLFF
jgi:hypothetical protein